MEENRSAFRGTTIVAVQKDGKTAVAGDGQVTMGETTIMKHGAKKVRRIYEGKVVVGFAGSVADAFALSEKFEACLEQFAATCPRSRGGAGAELAHGQGHAPAAGHAPCRGQGQPAPDLGHGRGHRAGRRGAGHRLGRKLRALRRARARAQHGTLRPRRSSARRWRSPRRSACTPMTTSRSRRCERDEHHDAKANRRGTG